MLPLCNYFYDVNINASVTYYSSVFVFFWLSYFFYVRIETVIGHLLLTFSTQNGSIESTLMSASTALQTVKSIEELNHTVNETLRRLFGFTRIQLYYATLSGGGHPLPDIYQMPQISTKIKATRGIASGMSTMITAKNCPDESLQRYLNNTGISVVFVLYYKQKIACVIEAYGKPAIGFKSDVVAKILVYYLDLALLHIIQIHQLVEQKVSAEREKTESMRSLAASIAHEMRNPLSQIHGNLWFIEEQVSHIDMQNSIVTEHIGEAQKVINSGLQIIDMIMDAIREKAVNPYNLEMLSARELVEETINSYAYEETEQSKMVSVKGDDFELLAESVMVKYVLYNLIKNALYYVSAQPEAEITISIIPSVNGMNHIEVRDTGPGIAAQAIPRLFDSFYTSGKQGGTGLGLFFCKRTMNSLGGNIDCHSELGHYTAFTLHFPTISDEFIRDERAIYQSSSVEPLSLSGKTILIVEDQKLSRIYVKALLENMGLNCLEAENGKEALDILSSQGCDLILTDMQMPVMNGLELIKAVRQRERVAGNKKIPIIVLSAEKGGMVDAAMQFGVSDYLIKPACADKLTSKLQRLFAH